MKTVLFAGLEPSVAKELRGDFKSSLLLRKHLVKYLRHKIESSRKELREKSNYEDASWAYRQADGVGYERALHEIITLLEENEA